MAEGDLGAWTSAELAATAGEHDGAGSDQDLDKSLRFRRNVARLVNRRWRRTDGRRDALAIFVLDQAPRSGDEWQRVPMLDNGETEIVGRVWFVNEVVRSGRFREVTMGSDAGAFDYVCQELRRGDKPAIIYNPRVSPAEARYYPQGMSTVDKCDVFCVGNMEVTVESVKEVIRRVYENVLITPDALVDEVKALWKDPDRKWVSKQAEATIQAHVKTGLAVHFFDCSVRHERKLVSGRIDLEIERRDPQNPGSFTRPAVIEIKALRTFRCTGRRHRAGAIRRWIESGVRQVAAYRDECSAAFGILCCFDMRCTDSGEECFEHVEEMAARLSVALDRWFLYGSSREYREAKFS